MSEAQPPRRHYTLKWHDCESKTVLDISLMKDGSLSLREEVSVRDLGNGELKPCDSALITVPANQVDQLVEAMVLIQIKRKEHPQNPRAVV